MAPWISHILLTAILIQQVHVFVGQPSIRDASTCPFIPLTCASAASKFAIRTASYVNSEQCARSSTCTGSDCKMRDDDIIRVYRKCSENVTSCDLSSAGVSSDYNITYYCLNNEMKDPCEDNEFRWSGSGISLFVDYSRYSVSGNFACQCHVTHNGGTDGQRAAVSVMNMFESRAGSRDPHVVIESSTWEWSLKLKILPTLWYMERDSAANLTFGDLNAASFGQMWIDFRGHSLQFFCNSTRHSSGLITSPPPGSMTSDSGVFPTSSTGDQSQSGPSLVIIIAAAAAGLSLVILIVVVVIVAIKCKRMKARNKEMENLKLPSHELSTVTRSGGIHNLGRDGDYCVINDVKPPPVVGICRSRDHTPTSDSKEQWSPPNYKKNGGGYGLTWSQDFGRANIGYEKTASDFETTSLESESSWRDYKPSSRDHKFALRDYDLEPSPHDNEPRSRGYTPKSRDYDREDEQQPRDCGPTSSDYELTSYEYESKSHDTNSRDYELTPRDYERTSRSYKPMSHVYNPPSSLQRSLAYDAQRKASQRKSRPLAERDDKPGISVISRGEDLSGLTARRRNGGESSASPSAASSDYGSLRYQPGQLTSPVADNVIYDRAGFFRADNGEDVYNRLTYGKPRAQVIDNIYDNSTFV